MGVLHWIVNQGIRTLTALVCRIDKTLFPGFPDRGPLIVVFNHIGSLEVPLLLAHLQPRPVVGLAKVETWDSPLMGWLFDQWNAIPVRRGEVDLEAVRRCLEVLKAGQILAVAPEGTRSRHGRLLRGQAGVVTLALRSGAPILPVAHWGVEDFPRNLRRLKRTDFNIGVGKPFLIDPGGVRVTGEIRQQIADEIMAQIAALLPEKYRGAYAEHIGRQPIYLKPL